MWVRTQWVRSNAPEFILNHLKNYFKNLTEKKKIIKAKVNPHDRIDGIELTSVFHKNMEKELNEEESESECMLVYLTWGARDMLCI